MSTRRILAAHDDRGVVVYQAYRPELADQAVALGRFGDHFSRARMTWIKPSFGWMLYRSGYATKPGQERVLRLKVAHEGFLAMLAVAVPSSHDPDLFEGRAAWSAALKRAPARYQWDPDRDLALRPLPRRALQLGIEGELTRRYADEWIVELADVTALAHAVRDAIAAGREPPPVPQERDYQVPPEVARRLSIL